MLQEQSNSCWLLCPAAAAADAAEPAAQPLPTQDVLHRRLLKHLILNLEYSLPVSHQRSSKPSEVAPAQSTHVVQDLP